MKFSLGIAMLKMITRPTFTNGLVWSLSVHTVTGVATFAWCLWLIPSQPAWLSHEQQVVQLEMQFSEPQPPRTAVPLEISFERLAESQPIAMVPQVVALNRSSPAPSPERMGAALEQVREISPRIQRSTVREQAMPMKEHVKLQKRPREVPPPVAMASVQIPGAEQKRADMSGNAPPHYPPMAIRNGYEGTVLLRLHVAVTGHVDRVDIIRSSGHAVLDEAARQAVLNWRGQPATSFGKAITSVETLPVRFRL